MTYQKLFLLAKSKGFDNIQVTEETKKENSIYLINTKTRKQARKNSISNRSHFSQTLWYYPTSFH